MKKLILALSLALASPAVAQEVPPALAGYRQLLSEANDRVANLLGENAKLNAELEKSKKEKTTEPKK